MVPAMYALDSMARQEVSRACDYLLQEQRVAGEGAEERPRGAAAESHPSEQVVAVAACRALKVKLPRPHSTIRLPD